MIPNLIKSALIVACSVFGTSVFADNWTLDADTSRLAFGSVKKDTVGEVHSFERISGKVDAAGKVSVDIDLSSVQTNIDIRNERIQEFVFGGAPMANLTASIDMEELSQLAVGATMTTDIEGALSFLGASIDIEAEIFVARLSETQVMVTTNDMIFVGIEDLGISAGIDKLMELAKLPGITRTSPITVRMIFNMDEKKAEAAPAAPATTELAFAGDTKRGKKIFNKCKACHSVKETKNGVGPSLYKIMNATAGQVDGYKYSVAMLASGLTWDVATMTSYLQNPKSFVPGTKMQFPGLKKEKDINDLIAYLASK